MALSRLDQLYRAVIVDHYNKPHHYGSLANASNSIELRNPTCGDVIILYLDIQDDVIQDVAFAGEGCAISTASASMMSDLIIGKTLAEAQDLAHTFYDMVTAKNEDQKQLQKDLGEAALLAGVKKFPARIKCATLGWKAMEGALDDRYGQDTSLDIEDLEGE
ncbi:hypothetical protein AWM75_08265 [Aerococcus urinaehominis]|uniref:Uncharacterized protein n=1 Tax=Aerococcus urinaehominis TaxID=128944 RepID=A0A0X8FMT5_9LACT|nr:SUF system NifU family Fe-S cluster assembly protein [Aerococcus urinaehominis]AMB99964.1 hypothetical protein AWM75_08265 [Aerococcus urinaehominis]SDM44791.1 nitrogen fixation protein NifU [Aerococcus urinaehominis]